MSSSKIVIALIAVLALSACKEKKNERPVAEDDDTCTSGGEVYEVGDVIPRDGEPSCVCLAGGIVGQCTGANTETCEDHGETYQVGDVIPSVDAGATSCVCLAGGIVGQCTGENTGDDVCESEGNTYHVGDTVPLSAGSGHPSCLCLTGGVIGQCTGVIDDDDASVRDDSDAGEDQCESDGEIYEVGDPVRIHGNLTPTCQCLAGGVIGHCTGLLPEP